MDLAEINDLIVKYRQLQNGHRVDSGYNRGVTDCIRILAEKADKLEQPELDDFSDFYGGGDCC